MNLEQYKKLLILQERQAIALEKIATLLQQHLPRQPAPNYKAVLEEFDDYRWQDINARVEVVDQYGAATVIWNGERYKRRSPDNAYGAVIFFSRCIGKNDDGSNKYERLITFEPLAQLKVEPISTKAEQILDN